MTEERIFAIIVTIISGPIFIWTAVTSGKKWKKRKNKETKKAG